MQAIIERTPEQTRDKIAEWLEYKARVLMSDRKNKVKSVQEGQILYDQAKVLEETAKELRNIPCF